MWLAPLVTMLAIVVLGGLGSLKGSLIGALIIGYVEAITVFARARRAPTSRAPWRCSSW